VSYLRAIYCIFSIPTGSDLYLQPGVAYFDMAILQAKRLLVDESALTGEVHPIAKIPLDIANADLPYSFDTNKSSTIFAGSTILECGDGMDTDGDLAIVTKTGSFTTKGKFLSEVLSYERHRFKFDTEVKLVLTILASEAIILFSLVISMKEEIWVYTWFYAMFVVGTVLPPLLPTVFVVSVGISCKRLQDRRITCTDSRGILVAGKVHKVFFDKTGTLTKQGLEFHPGDESEHETYQLKQGLAVCQEIQLSNDGSLVGPAVDRIGFAASSATFVNENTVCYGGENIRYLKRFEFDHERMTQSVIVRRGEEVITYVKGSPEAISKLCLQSSLPSNFLETSRQSARDGVYQLAMATSAYQCNKAMHEVNRDDIEKDLDFLGFVNFQNSLKEESAGVIEELRRGNISCVMITVRGMLSLVN
jgi:magnesium-transporting ATPase (P-type)